MKLMNGQGYTEGWFMMASKNARLKKLLKELCKAHSEVLHAREEHKREDGHTQILLEMYDQKLCELETQITVNLKSWLNMDGCLKQIQDKAK
jgi:hypothetical protein